MKIDAWHLPWGRDTVSHAVLDINRGCNIACRACYNQLPRAVKPLSEIAGELKALKARRRLAYISLVGGEPLLHPELDELLRLLKREGLCTQMFSNGLLLNDARLERLKQAGLDILYFHIDGGQTRPDLPADPSPGRLRALWDAKAELIARHGIDAGLAITAFRDRLSEMRDAVEYVADSPHVHCLLVTLFRDTGNIGEIHGDLDSGLRGSLADPSLATADTLTNRDVAAYLQQELGLRPFGYLGANTDPDDPRWLSYQLAVRRGLNGVEKRYCPRPSAFESVYCALSRRFAGKYPMYLAQSGFRLIVQLFFNALAGGDFSGNLGFLLRAFRPGGTLLTKRLLFQCPAHVSADGTVTHCEVCPDAVTLNGGLVPVCISDKVARLPRAELLSAGPAG